MLHLRSSLEGLLGVEVGGTYPIRLTLQFGETGDAFHEVGRVLVPILNHCNALHTQRLVLGVFEMLQIHLGQVIFFDILSD